MWPLTGRRLFVSSGTELLENCLIYEDAVARAMLLRPSEQVLLSEQVETGPGGTKHEGTLYLTNLRLIFERLPGRGQVGPLTLLDTHLAMVTNILVNAPKFGRALLQVETRTGTFSFRTKNPQQWSAQIGSARSQAPPPPPKAPRSPVPSPTASNQPIVIQLQQDRAPPSVFLHCTHCGTLSAAGTTRCGSCGATL